MARKMKDSGIEWIGEIPEGWEVAKLKNIASIVRGGSPRPIEAYMSDNDNDVNWIRISDTEKGSKYITHTSRKLIASGISKSRFIKRGSLILTNSMSFGEPYILDIDGCIHDGWVAFSDFKKIDKEFLYYFLTSPLAKIQFEQQVDGGVVKNLNIDKIGDTVILLPSLIDQNKIIAHLDSLTSETNSLLSKTITSIEEYKQLKQAVITQAVTKGVRGKREMKDSGVEWIGAIPKDWEIKRLKSFCTIVDCKNRTPDVFPDGKYTVVRTTCIKDCSFSYEGSYQTDTTNFKAWTLKGQPHKGDIFFTREAPVGEACLVPNADNLCMGQRVMFFRPEDNSDARYIMYSIYGPLVREYIASKNSGSTVGHLKLGQVACIPIFYCPPLEQKEIADYLDAKCAEIDKLIAKKEQLVKELESYKKSLIYEVVTGKREV